MTIRAVVFDVDFTLIYPGPTFRGEGYRQFASRHGLEVDVAAFDRAVASAAAILDRPDDEAYDAGIFIRYTRHILEQMGGSGELLDACAREIYDEWAACRHFELYDDVPPALRALARAAIRVGLISNSHRCLDSFQTHFALDGLIAASVSSSEHGLMKPHPSIFRAALDRLGVQAGEALMVGDNVRHDVEGALATGMRAALLHRPDTLHPLAPELAARGIPIVRSLAELPALIEGDG